MFLDNVYPNHAADLTEEQKIDLCAHDRLLYVGGKYPGTIATVLEGEDSLVSDGSTHTPKGNRLLTVAVLLSVHRLPGCT